MMYLLAKIMFIPLTSYLVKEVRGIENIPKKSGFIIAANHASYFDPIIIPAFFFKKFKRQVHYLGKKELFRPWVMKVFHNQVGTIPINREGDENALDKAVQALKQNKIIGIFPEGGRSRDNSLRKGKTGAARLSLWSKKPVIPIGIKGSYEIWPANKKLFKLKKAIILEIGKPMTFEKYYDKKINKTILNVITTKIMQEIARLTGKKYNYK